MIGVNTKIEHNMHEVIQDFDRETLKYDSLAERAGLIARGMIIERLVSVLGEAKAKHFTVQVRPHPLGMTVFVAGLDEVATFIVKGASPHSMQVGNGQAMPIDGGMFATSVSHPGFDGQEDVLWSTVRMAAAEAFAMAVSYG